jgi:hypothetical protein
VERISTNKKVIFIRVFHSPLLIEILSLKFRVFKTKDKTFIFEKVLQFQGLEKTSPIKKLCNLKQQENVLIKNCNFERKSKVG